MSSGKKMKLPCPPKNRGKAIPMIIIITAKEFRDYP